MSRRRKKRTSFLSAIILEVSSIFAIIAIVQPNWTFALVQALDNRTASTGSTSGDSIGALDAGPSAAFEATVGRNAAAEETHVDSQAFADERREPTASVWGASGSATAFTKTAFTNAARTDSTPQASSVPESAVLPPPQRSAWLPPVHYSARRLPLYQVPATQSGIRPPHEWTPHVEYR